MKISDFDFDLPEELIAQQPAAVRDQSELLLCQESGSIKQKFYKILDQIRPDDLLVFNNSKVIKAELSLKKNDREIHVNLNKEIEPNLWTGFARPGKKLKIGNEFSFGEHRIIIEEKDIDGIVKFRFDLNGINVIEFLEEYGRVPLPPYIKRDKPSADDQERYQSLLAKHEGSVAAPTASLHFSDELLTRIKDKGAEFAFVTLHVGAGTYLPVKVDNIAEHVMHSEYASIEQSQAEKINTAKLQGRRVIIVGTTALRSLESFCQKDGTLSCGTKDTNIFIKPGYEFHIPDTLITNFHLPKSTLFMLICAFAGFDEMHKAYDYAIKERMRFFSYGDAMMIFRK